MADPVEPGIQITIVHIVALVTAAGGGFATLWAFVVWLVKYSMRGYVAQIAMLSAMIKEANEKIDDLQNRDRTFVENLAGRSTIAIERTAVGLSHIAEALEDVGTGLRSVGASTGQFLAIRDQAEKIARQANRISGEHSERVDQASRG